MRRTPRADRGEDPDWGMLIRAELNSYYPQRLPARFTPRSRQTSPAPAWRSLAIGMAAAVLGVLAVAGVERPAGITGAWHQLAGVHTPVTPSATATPEHHSAPPTTGVHSGARSTGILPAPHRTGLSQPKARSSQPSVAPSTPDRDERSPSSQPSTSNDETLPSTSSRVVPQILPASQPASTQPAPPTSSPASTSSKGSCLPSLLSVLCPKG